MNLLLKYRRGLWGCQADAPLASGVRDGSWRDIAFASTCDFPHRGKSRSSRRARCYQGALATRCAAQATSCHPSLVSVQAVSGVPIESLVQPLSYLGLQGGPKIRGYCGDTA